MAENQSEIDAAGKASQPETLKLGGASSGPPTHSNWLALNVGMPCLETAEFPLFTDARISAEISQGPYQFLNTVPNWEAGMVQPAIILRCDFHAEFSQPDMTKTDLFRYHGGSFPEEIAALSSLAMGARLRAGGVTRRFEPKGDPKGRPSEWARRTHAGLILRKDSRGWVLPNASEGDHSLTALDILAHLPKLSASAAIALVKAARLYQEALWLVETETPLSWLLMVSAVETAANQWRSQKEAPAERLKDSKPVLYRYLEVIGTDVLAAVAKEIAEVLGATSKFIGFVLEFLPPPPSARPPVGFRCSWSETAIRKAMRLIYDHRSRALHDGRPFPLPMCEIPFTLPGWPAPAERPVGLAAAAQGGVWLSKDTPMHFHTFEHIARGVLLNWWRKGAPADEEDGGGR